MDEARTRKQIEDHAAAAQAGDMDTVVNDFVEELRPDVMEIGKDLPNPITEAEIVSIEFGEDKCVATIKYSGDESQGTIESHWQEVGGQPQIVHAEPA